MRFVVVAITSGILMLMLAAPVHAYQPPVLGPAMPSEDGIRLSWADATAAQSYILTRTGQDGVSVDYVLPGSVTEFMDAGVEPGVYSYVLTAQRADSQDESNPSLALAWPGCLPGVDLNPINVYWYRHCYCPFPPEIEDLEFLLCNT